MTFALTAHQVHTKVHQPGAGRFSFFSGRRAPHADLHILQHAYLAQLWGPGPVATSSLVAGRVLGAAGHPQALAGTSAHEGPMAMMARPRSLHAWGGLGREVARCALTPPYPAAGTPPRARRARSGLVDAVDGALLRHHQQLHGAAHSPPPAPLPSLAQRPSRSAGALLASQVLPDAFGSAAFPVPSLYLPCTFPVRSLYLPCTFLRQARTPAAQDPARRGAAGAARARTDGRARWRGRRGRRGRQGGRRARRRRRQRARADRAVAAFLRGVIGAIVYGRKFRSNRPLRASLDFTPEYNGCRATRTRT